MKRPPYHFVLAMMVLSACAAAEPSPPVALPGDTPAPNATNPPGDNAEISFVFDGDSLEAVLDDGAQVEVRLLGINAPEGDECFGDEARSALEEWLHNGQAALVADDEETDQFGRVLRYIYVDGVNVNQSLIETGHALAIQNGHALDDAFAESSDRAAAAGIGMWAGDACGDGADTVLITIADYVFDPPGRDADSPNEEWVAIANRTGGATQMDGWVLRDESTQNRFRFPAGFTLKDDDEVLIHSGCGTNSPSDLYWCAADPVWSNGGDAIVLQNADGTIVARERYAGAY